MRTHRLPKWGKCLLILAGLLAALLCAMLLAQTLVAHRPGTSFTPDYAQEDLSALLAQASLSDSDYQTLFLQTGLGRSAVDRLLSAGEAGRAAIRQIQTTFFADYTITCDPLLGWFTREDLLTQGKIENQGYLDNYVMYDRQLRPMESLARRCRRYFPL